MDGSSFLASLLKAVPAGVYYAVQKSRAEAYSAGLWRAEKAPTTVISVGNIVLGGSGKTPFVIYLTEMMLRRGLKPAVVSRGYRGSNRALYLVVSDGISKEPLVSPSVSGDEPFLIASRLPGVPVLVGRRRIHPVTAAHKLFASNAVILDDGFQHLALHRDADLVLLSGAEDRMFPLGSLREPLSALERADIIVTVGETAALPPAVNRYVGHTPVFRCNTFPVTVWREGWQQEPDHFSGQDVVMLSGIAHPERFRATADSLGWRVTQHLTFPDHYRITDNELRAILRSTHQVPVVVTEKDWVKLPLWARETGRISALRIGMRTDDEDLFWGELENLVWSRSAKSASRG
jgi:tetraacyldisaccharide 4'-kinase